GSLTYYFDGNNQLDRIAFHGTMGDPRLLTAFVTQTYTMEKKNVVEPNTDLYQATWHGNVISELRIRLANQVQVHTPHARYEVHLLLTRPRPRAWFPENGESSVQTRVKL